MTDQQAAFMSYSRTDDRNNAGFISKLREKLSHEIQGQGGIPFNIFQDNVNLTVGANWRRVLRQTLDEVTFLIAIMTPNFFTSAACREEVAYFLEREQRLGRDDLILPIYYIESQIVCNSDRRRADPEAALLFETLSGRQHSDWRELRGLSISAPHVKRKIIDLARDITAKANDPDLHNVLLLRRDPISPDEDTTADPLQSADDQIGGLAPDGSDMGTKLRLVPPPETSGSNWSELSQALAQVDLTPADSSLLAVRTVNLRRLLRLDYPQIGKRGKDIQYIKDELLNTLDSLALTRKSAAENAMACRAVDRLRDLLAALILEIL